MAVWAQTKKHESMGVYSQTSLDGKKNDAHFLLLQVSPFVIRWNDGKVETVTSKKLDKLKTIHAWKTDF